MFKQNLEKIQYPEQKRLKYWHEKGYLKKA
jgi:hypothetical protein